MKRYVLIALGIVFLLFTFTNGDEPNKKAKLETASTITPKRLADQPMSVWMKRKLGYSQTIFKALAMGDLDTVKFNASQMNLVGKVEGFARIKNRPYQAQLHAFDRISFEIAQQADKGNIEGATLAFNQLTVNCVQCHKMLRADAAEDL